ncbi:MAG TPA: hypothetical protein VG101_09105 [Puia sp.]|nr:hypothetical protein [Puia sp.]
MKETLRLNIPVPCTEDWEKMLPAERGRHCQQCCKTVVDFTGMSDEEVMRFFVTRAEGAGSGATDGGGVHGEGGGGVAYGEGGVCGRFASDQLGRELAPAPVQRNGFKGWPLVVAGALVLGQGQEGARQEKTGKVLRQVGSGVRSPMEMGETVTVPDTSVLLGDTTLIRDTSVDMGIPVVMVGDVEERKMSVKGEIALNDTVEAMPADTVTAVVKPKEESYTGLVVIVPDTTMGVGKRMDTVSRIKVAIDTVVNIWKDTVAAVSAVVGPDEAVKVYPNPVMRGGMVRLLWGVEDGRYQVAMISVGGGVVQERVVVVGGKGQVDEWALPEGLAAGVYFLRVVGPGTRAYTVEVLVQ